MNLWSRITSKAAEVPAPVTPASEAAEAPAETAPSPGRERLDHLFRAGPRQGAVNPLYFALLRYRQQQEQKPS
ncbi:hypothetical protein [Pelomonas sp. KK5]|uniref:hypothetical protein n=1 Tax=Pelomonas sp. KK5 TaxID=1855730 RepID=UPI00097C4C5C|nr:hypothetical protein [Pelomonas sp. KK5]